MGDQSRAAIVTGAASGLGRALAVCLAKDGWQIALADIDMDGAEETLRLVQASGGAGRVERLNVARLDEWEALRDRLRADWPRLDLLINNAGLGCSGDVGEFPLEEWRLLLSVNLYGAIYGCHALIDWLKENTDGAHIINVASFAGIAPSPSMAAYNVTKAGVVSLSETLHGELKPHGVGVTVVCPMYFRTNIGTTNRFYNKLTAKIIEEGTANSDMTADDVAEAAIRAMERKQLYAMPGREARWYWWMRRLSPRGFLDGVARNVAERARAESDSNSRESAS